MDMQRDCSIADARRIRTVDIDNLGTRSPCREEEIQLLDLNAKRPTRETPSTPNRTREV